MIQTDSAVGILDRREQMITKTDILLLNLTRIIACFFSK